MIIIAAITIFLGLLFVAAAIDGVAKAISEERKRK